MSYSYSTFFQGQTEKYIYIYLAQGLARSLTLLLGWFFFPLATLGNPQKPDSTRNGVQFGIKSTNSPFENHHPLQKPYENLRFLENPIAGDGLILASIGFLPPSSLNSQPFCRRDRRRLVGGVAGVIAVATPIDEEQSSHGGFQTHIRDCVETLAGIGTEKPPETAEINAGVDDKHAFLHDDAIALQGRLACQQKSVTNQHNFIHNDHHVGHAAQGVQDPAHPRVSNYAAQETGPAICPRRSLLGEDPEQHAACRPKGSRRGKAKHDLRSCDVIQKSWRIQWMYPLVI